MSQPAWEERRFTEIERRLGLLDEKKADNREVIHLEQRIDRHSRTVAEMNQRLDELLIKMASVEERLISLIDENRWLRRTVLAMLISLVGGVLIYAATIAQH